MDYKAQLKSYAAKYPNTDLFEFVHGQLEKGILVVEDRHGRTGTNREHWENFLSPIAAARMGGA